MQAPSQVSAAVSLDDKGRVVVPADIRKSLGGLDEPIDLWVGQIPGKSYVSLHPKDYHGHFIHELERQLEDEEMGSMIAMSFTLSTTDKVGRLTLPTALREDLKLEEKSKVIFVSKVNHFEIWTQEYKDRKLAEMKNNADSKAKIAAATRSVFDKLAAKPSPS